MIVLLAEAANGWTDAPCSTSSAVASGSLSGRKALMLTVLGNFVGLIIALLVGAAVAKTIGKGIVRPEMITVDSIGLAMITSILWSLTSSYIGTPISKTHALLASLAGMGYARGGIDALLPASANFHDSGWVVVGEGVLISILCGSALAWFISSIISMNKFDEKISPELFKKIQWASPTVIATGHGFNDGLKYVGILTLILFKSNIIPEFQVLPQVIGLCAVVMAAGSLMGGWKIQRTLDNMVNNTKKKYKPYMGVCADLVSGFMIWQTGWLGIPASTNHAVVSAMVGAKSAGGKVKLSTFIKIMWGWIITYIFCFFVSMFLTKMFS